MKALRTKGSSMRERIGDDYEITDDGRVYSTTRKVRFVHPVSGEECFRLHVGKEISQQVDNFGYKVCTISRQRRRVHRLVAAAFIPNPYGLPVVRHLNHNPTDNRVENLAWGTQKQNAADSAKIGRMGAPRRIPDEVIARALELVAGGASHRKAAAEVGICQTYLSKIIRGKSKRGIYDNARA